MNPERKSRRKALMMLSVAMAAAGAAGLSVLFSGAAHEGDTGPVTETARLAMEAMQQIAATESLSSDPETNAAQTLPLGTFSKAERADLRTLNMEQVAEAVAAGDKRLKTYFAGRQLAWFSSVNDQVEQRYAGLMLPQGAPGSPEADRTVTADYVVTGGVDDFAVDSVTSDADSARVTGTGRIWIISVMVWPNSTQVVKVSNSVSFDARLKDFDGTWKVVEYRDEFAPGSEP